MTFTPTALIDSNVFYGARLRSLMLFVAQAGLYRARWTRQINAEWVANVLANRPDLSESRLQPTVNAMNAALEDCLVENYKSLIKGLQLPDPDDRHVLAAAIRAGTDVIVTFNLKDFSKCEIGQYGIDAVHPDRFLKRVLADDRNRFVRAVTEDFIHYRNPKLAFSDYLASLDRAGCPKLVRALDNLRGLVED